MDKWEEVSFKEVVNNFDGKRIPIKASERKNKNGGEYAYYGASGIIDYVDDYIFEGEHLLISEDGANLLARVYPIAFKANGKFWVNNHAHIVQAKNDITTNDYLEYYFSSIDISSYVTGSAQPKLNQKKLNSIKIPLPPLPEQKRIVAKLDEVFEKIDQAIGLLEENIAHTQALMGSMLDGIFEKVAQSYKTSPLLKHVDFVGGSQPPKSSFSYEEKDSYVRLIQIRDYKSDKHLVYIKEDSTKKFCEEDDVMIGRYGPPVFQILRGLKGAYNVALMKAIPNEDVISKDYLYYFLMNGKIQNYIISISQRSAGQSGVNKKALEAYKIAIPPMEEQKRIVDTIKAAIPKINKTQKLTNQSLENLRALKSSLLDQAFKGEL